MTCEFWYGAIDLMRAGAAAREHSARQSFAAHRTHHRSGALHATQRCLRARSKLQNVLHVTDVALHTAQRQFCTVQHTKRVRNQVSAKAKGEAQGLRCGGDARASPLSWCTARASGSACSGSIPVRLCPPFTSINTFNRTFAAAACKWERLSVKHLKEVMRAYCFG